SENERRWSAERTITQDENERRERRYPESIPRTNSETSDYWQSPRQELLKHKHKPQTHTRTVLVSPSHTQTQTRTASQEQIPKHQNIRRLPGKSNPNPNPHSNTHTYAGLQEKATQTQTPRRAGLATSLRS